MKIILFFFLFLISLTSCAPSSMEDYQLQAKVCVRNINKELRRSHDRNDLIKSQKKLKKRFGKLTDVIIAMRLFSESHPDVNNQQREDLLLEVNEMKHQLQRIYEIDGGRELIESAQKNSFLKLSHFEQPLDGH